VFEGAALLGVGVVGVNLTINTKRVQIGDTLNIHTLKVGA